MLKKIIFPTFLVIAISFSVNAQSGFGIKAGYNYNSNGDLKADFQSIPSLKSSGKSGFNIGIYDKFNLGLFYIRPELVYTKTNSQYLLNNQNQNYNLSKLDLPILVGLNVIGPLNIFAGPDFQYILSNNLTGLGFQSIKNNYTLGLNIGASVELGKIGIDIRYERGLNANEANFLENNIANPSLYILDTRPQQFIVNLSYSLSN